MESRPALTFNRITPLFHELCRAFGREPPAARPASPEPPAPEATDERTDH